MAGQAPENQDHVLFDLFGRKREANKDKMYDDQMMQPSALQAYHLALAAQHGGATHNQAQSAPAQSRRAQYLTAGETEKQQHTCVPGKFHSTASPDSTSSREKEEEEAGQRKTGGSKKKGENDKLPGGHHSS